jgi:hypothetical protein
VRSSDLTPEQAEKLKNQIGQRLHFLNRLVDRMTRRGFEPTEDLYAAALRSRAALYELRIKAHYAGCKHGVGKREEVGWSESDVRRA